MGSAVADSACGLFGWLDKEGASINKGAGRKNRPAKEMFLLFIRSLIPYTFQALQFYAPHNNPGSQVASLVRSSGAKAKIQPALSMPWLFHKRPY